MYFHYNDLSASYIPRICRRNLCFPVLWSIYDLMFTANSFLAIISNSTMFNHCFLSKSYTVSEIYIKFYKRAFKSPRFYARLRPLKGTEVKDYLILHCLRRDDKKPRSMRSGICFPSFVSLLPRSGGTDAGSQVCWDSGKDFSLMEQSPMAGWK